MRLKICGMKHNMKEVAVLQPNYMGFIFWEPSKRYFKGSMPKLPVDIKKVGVFVDASMEEIIAKVEQYNLQAVQLHGMESPGFCEILRQNLSQVLVEIIKVFSIKDNFDFTILESYEDVCDYYLFDTKGKFPGGNGYTFDWTVLKEYPSSKPYFLSGGIGLEETDSVLSFLRRPESTYCYALDVNSKFEIEPGLKDIDDLKTFKNLLAQYC